MGIRKAARIANCEQDENGMIDSPYGMFNPVTGEGLPIEAPDGFMRQVLQDLIQAGLDSGIDESFDIDGLMQRNFGTD